MLASAPALSMPKARSSMAAGPDQAVQGPGPGAYFCTDPSTDPGGIGRDAPAFSMGGRQQQRQKGVQWEYPGPGEYFRWAVSLALAGARRGRAWGWRTGSSSAGGGRQTGRLEALTHSISSSRVCKALYMPALRCLWLCDRREAAAEVPAFSMASRTPGAGPAGSSSTDTPGPGHYSLAGVAAGEAVGSAAAPAWIIAGRVGDAAAAAVAVRASQPGPGSYDVGAQDLQGPAYSIQGRPTASGGQPCKAGCHQTVLLPTLQSKPWGQTSLFKRKVAL